MSKRKEKIAADAVVIEEIESGQCPSLSGQSTLTYAIGKSNADGSLHLRITANTGAGMFCKDWVSVEAITKLLESGKPLTSRTVQALHRGRSINTGGFLLAALLHLGLVRASGTNSRQHEAIPGKTLARG